MNKTAIKNFAVWARRKLISEITYKAGLLGVTENGAAEPLPQSTRDLQFFDIGTKNYAEVKGAEIAQRSALVAAIKEKAREVDDKTAFQNIVEEVAYTWFNRMIAIRFMEINDYLPSRIRVLSSENPSKLEPDFVTTPFDTDLDFTPDERDRVLQLKDENKLDELFRALFIKQCNKLHEILPELFEETSDYTELLLTISFTDKDGVVYHLTHDIPESDFDISHTDEDGKTPGQVEIIGWMYQYYNTEPKDEVFALLKKNVKITKERIPAATQLFTPDWIVRYMIENSLGRLWLEHLKAERETGTLIVPMGVSTRQEGRTVYIDSEDSQDTDDNFASYYKANWKYYLDEAKQEPDVEAQLQEVRRAYKDLTPEEIKLIDPCMGSGHILVYAFDVLMQIYEAQGYTQRDAARLIVEKNLYGLDIDKRAYQLAYFAVMMKARQYNRRILNGEVKPNLYAIDDSAAMKSGVLDFIANGDQKMRADLQSIADDLTDAKEYGSIINVAPVDFDALFARFEAIRGSYYDDIFDGANQQSALNTVLPLVKQAQAMAQKYDVVVTNPPYMKADSMPVHLAAYILEKWETAKYDLYAAFIYRAYSFLKKDRIAALITMHNFMYAPSFLDMRIQIMHWDWLQLLHLGTRAFSEIGGEVVQTAAFVLCNSSIQRNITVCDLTAIKDADGKEKAFHQHIAPMYVFNLEKIKSIPNYAFGYALSDVILDFYGKNSTLEGRCVSKAGVVTGNDDFFCKLWYEVNLPDITFVPDSHKLYKYVPFSRGGAFSSWYGNTHHVLRVEDMYNDKLTNKSVRRGDIDFYYRTGVGWSQMGGGINKNFSIIENSICKTTTPMIYCTSENELFSILGYLNSPIPAMVLKSLNPTLSILTSDILHLPFIPITHDYKDSIKNVKTCIQLSREDSNSYENSWDFKRNPLV